MERNWRLLPINNIDQFHIYLIGLNWRFTPYCIKFHLYNGERTSAVYWLTPFWGTAGVKVSVGCRTIAMARGAWVITLRSLANYRQMLPHGLYKYISVTLMEDKFINTELHKHCQGLRMAHHKFLPIWFALVRCFRQSDCFQAAHARILIASSNFIFMLNSIQSIFKVFSFVNILHDN